MTTIYFSVTDNRITLKSRDAVVSENYQNYLLDFSFDDGWADLAKVVTLKTGSGDPVSIPYSGPFVLPAGAASVGGMKVSVSGYLGTEPMTVARTAVMAHDIPILPAGIAPELPEEYDPTTLDMIFAAIGDLSSLSTDDKRSLVLAINETLVDAKDYADQKFDEAAGYVSEARQAAQEAAQSAAASSASSTAAALSERNARSAADNAAFSASSADNAAAKARLFATSASTSSSSASSSALRASNAQAAAEAAQAAAEDAQEAAETAAATFETDKTLTVSDKAADAKVTGDWILAAFPTDTESGSIVTIQDGADGIPVQDLTVQITPVQAGSGDPSPSNIRPITGWTGCTVTRAGKNLCRTQPEYTNTSGTFVLSFGENKTFDAVTVSFSAAGASFAASAQGAFLDFREADGTHHYVTPRNFVNENGTVMDTANTSYSGRFRASLSNITFERVVCYYTAAAWNKWASDLLSDFQIEVGPAATQYEAYAETAVPITWQTEAGTIYGGTLDVTTGLLTVTHVQKVLDGSDASRFATTASGLVRYNPSPNMASGRNYGDPCAMADKLKKVEAPADAGDYSIVFGSGNPYIYVVVPGGSTVEAVCAWLAENNVTIVYPIATQLTYQLTPQEVTTLLGVNNIWADTGGVSVTYRADATKYINKKIAEALASV